MLYLLLEIAEVIDLWVGLTMPHEKLYPTGLRFIFNRFSE